MKNLYDSISKRQSVRAFSKTKITAQDLGAINDYLQEVSTLTPPFGNKIVPSLINHTSGESEKIGNYGFVKNAAAFITSSIDNELNKIIDFGFIFELVVLKLVALNLGSVWLGGNFQGSSVKQFLPTYKLVPAVLAIGYPLVQPINEKSTSTVVKAVNRKPLTEIVTSRDGTITNELLTLVFEALRVSPSSTNQQPWRINLFKNYFELVYKRTPNYGAEFNYEMQGLDMGIALAHLQIALENFKIDYDLIPNKNLELNTPETLVATIKLKKPI